MSQECQICFIKTIRSYAGSSTVFTVIYGLMTTDQQITVETT